MPRMPGPADSRDRPVLAILTDFGLDGAVAACKGVILGICRDAQIIDGERKVSGKVRAVIPVGDERSRMVELRIALTDRWRVGAPVRVEIAPRDVRKVVTVPRDAVILRQGASYVMRVRADNTAERVAVNIGPGR